jgi:hypothetical protein
MYFLRRRSELSLDEFHAHWLEHHVRRYGSIALQARRYVLYRRLEPSGDVGLVAPDGIAYDGVAVVWFDDAKSARALMDSAVVIDALEDEKLFIDHDRSVAILATEEVLIEPDGWGPVVLFECLARGAGTERTTFRQQWLAHGQRAQHLHCAGLIQGYIQNHVVDQAEGVERYNDVGSNTESWDGIGVTYFHSVAAAKPFLQRIDGHSPLDGDSAFADSTRTVSMLTARRTMKDLVR